MTARDDFLAHLASGTTTLARAWRVVRRDGVMLGFTDHDQDIVLDGLLYKAATGMAAKALQQTTGLAVDNTEAIGALSDAGIDETDVMAGRFDGAEVTIWLLNWADPAQNIIEFRGSFGEVARASGTFKVDLRGMTEALNTPQGRVYQRGCDAVLGDAACKVDLSVPEFRADMVVQAVADTGEITLSGAANHLSEWFQLGRFAVVTGLGAGLSGMIKQDRRLGGGARRVALWQALPVMLSVGDSVTLQSGCDRASETCRTKFRNLINFQGFPHIPGDDWQISYPHEGAPKDGGSLFK